LKTTTVSSGVVVGEIAGGVDVTGGVVDGAVVTGSVVGVVVVSEGSAEGAEQPKNPDISTKTRMTGRTVLIVLFPLQTIIYYNR